MKRVAFPIINFDGITIEGNDSEFIFHGRILPFIFENSKNVTIKNINIDYKRPFFTQGQVIDASHNFVDLKIDKNDYPYKIENGKIVFYGEGWESNEYWNFLEMDPLTSAPTYSFGDNWVDSAKTTSEIIGYDIVRFYSDFEKIHNKGNIVVISHEQRLNPGFFSCSSMDIMLENINIYHSAAMGVIAQNTCNITLNKVNVKLRENTKRIVSAIADATHFVNCTGLVKVENCIFENQKDDPLNCHGIYTTISKIYGRNVIEVELIHPQQNGTNIYTTGDEIQFINRKSLLNYKSAVIKEVILVNQKFIRLVLNEELSGDIAVGDAVENVSRMPNLIIRNCKTGKNRARGFLVTTPGDVLIENNEIYSPGAGILIEGDANFWFESGAVKNVIIRNNQFTDCVHSPWGRAVIQISPGVSKETAYEQCYHRNILIENNSFKAFDKSILIAHSVDGLSFINNSIEKTDTYPPYLNTEAIIDLKVCKNVTIEGNKVLGFSDEKFISDSVKCCENVVVK